jgi:hypothetical protein
VIGEGDAHRVRADRIGERPPGDGRIVIAGQVSDEVRRGRPVAGHGAAHPGVGVIGQASEETGRRPRVGRRRAPGSTLEGRGHLVEKRRRTPPVGGDELGQVGVHLAGDRVGR